MPLVLKEAQETKEGRSPKNVGSAADDGTRKLPWFVLEIQGPFSTDSLENQTCSFQSREMEQAWAGLRTPRTERGWVLDLSHRS